MQSILVALVVFAAAGLAWPRLVGAIGIWWTSRHPPRPALDTDTYFIISSSIFRLARILPLMFFAAWYWRRFVSHAA
jgi:hypothetical protein